MKKYILEIMMVTELALFTIFYFFPATEKNIVLDLMPIAFIFTYLLWAILRFRKELESGMWLLEPEIIFSNWKTLPTWLRVLAFFDKHLAIAIAHKQLATEFCKKKEEPC